MRIAYPEMGMGRELLRLNLGMYAVLELRDTQITGEMRQAFKALLRLPPQQYIAPGEDSDAQERESMTYEQLVEQPLFFNPQLARGAPRRATREEEAEVVRRRLRGPTEQSLAVELASAVGERLLSTQPSPLVPPSVALRPVARAVAVRRLDGCIPQAVRTPRPIPPWVHAPQGR